MRKIREISSEEENFRTEPLFPGSIHGITKRDPVEPEPRGTIILVPFRITGYHADCDGSLMARLEAINTDLETTGWTENNIGIYPNEGFVVTEEELKNMSNKSLNADQKA